MITLSIILSIWGIISTYRLDKIAKKIQQPFNPFEGTFLDVFGFFVGIAVMVGWFLYLCIFYLP